METLVFISLGELLTMTICYQIEFTADYRSNVPLVRFIDKLKDPEHVSVVRDRTGLHLIFNRLVQHVGNGRGSVE